MVGEKGKRLSMIYRASSFAVAPFLFLLIHCRRLRGLEHPLRFRERFGSASLPRPEGPLLWFHAVSLGEGMAAIPIIKHCVQRHPYFSVLMTTTTTSAFNVIKDLLPDCVIYQFAPLDTPGAVDAFLKHWNPNAIFLVESELWPNLILSASEKGIALALLNARMSAKSFKLWSGSVALPLISLMLSKFSLITPLSTQEAIRFQLLRAPPFVINFAGDLKYAAAGVDVLNKESKKIEDLLLQISNRPIWMAASIHTGEDKVMLWIHKELARMYPNLLTIIVPRHPQEVHQIAQVLHVEGMNVSFRSQNEKISPSTNFFVVDSLGELRSLYRLTPIAVIGGSFLPGLAGHNISEAAASGCAVLTGPHVGHFSQMILEMQRCRPLSVQQVSGQAELLEALKELLGEAQVLEARRLAAKQTFLALSGEVVQNVWNIVDIHVLRRAFQKERG